MAHYKHYFRLFRVPNLLIIAATQVLMRYCIVQPLLQIHDFELQLSLWQFIALILATVTITAAGYVINDYFDNKTDLVNRPDKVIVGKYISRRAAMSWHIALNSIGIVLGLYVAYSINLWQIGLVFPVVAGLLWYYSTTYKHILVLGNLIVALLVGLVPFIVGAFEIPALNARYFETLMRMRTNFFNILLWVGGFGYFAFLTNLIREIIKDTEDFEGDRAYGRNTLPVATGTGFTKGVLIVLILCTIVSLGFIYNYYIKDIVTFWYFVVVLALPMLFVGIRLVYARDKQDFHLLSSIMKWIMLAGILYAPVACLILN